MKAVGVFPGSREVRLFDSEPPYLAAPDEVVLHMLDRSSHQDFCYSGDYPARLMREMVRKNQVPLGSVNAGPDAFAAIADLQCFREHWPEAVNSLIPDRYPPEQATELILERPTGIKSVISFREA